jgi:very-short-patch-repair endonuclease
VTPHGNALLQQGWRVLEFTTADLVDDPDYVLRTVRAAIFPVAVAP